ncbi:hypothetical protein Q7P37_006838 [Cladosporium fusiforme]
MRPQFMVTAGENGWRASELAQAQARASSPNSTSNTSSNSTASSTTGINHSLLRTSSTHHPLLPPSARPNHQPLAFDVLTDIDSTEARINV